MEHLSEHDRQKLNDLLDPNHIVNVIQDCEGIGFRAQSRFFNQGASKAPIRRDQLKKISSMSALIGHMQCVEQLMKFVENNDVIDGYDPNHDFAQALYGELCVYILKLDKILVSQYGVSSNIDKRTIEQRTMDYVNKFESRKENIVKLQHMLKNNESSPAVLN